MTEALWMAGEGPGVLLDHLVRSGLVVRLAQAAYGERLMPHNTLDKLQLAVLADALEEAGCTDGNLLEHLRSSGDHVRGCWAVDSILGKK